MELPIPKGKVLVGDERRTVVAYLARRYRSGASIRDLVAETGRSYGTIHRALTKAGVKLRRRGGDNRKKKPESLKVWERVRGANAGGALISHQ